jgi:hypothetical protein
MFTEKYGLQKIFQNPTTETTEVYYVCKVTSHVTRTRTPWRWGAAKEEKEV